MMVKVHSAETTFSFNRTRWKGGGGGGGTSNNCVSELMPVYRKRPVSHLVVRNIYKDKLRDPIKCEPQLKRNNTNREAKLSSYK